MYFQTQTVNTLSVLRQQDQGCLLIHLFTFAMSRISID